MRVLVNRTGKGENLYIIKSYVKEDGTTSSKKVKTLGSMDKLMKELNTDRDSVLEWARKEADKLTQEDPDKEGDQAINLVFHTRRRPMNDGEKVFRGGYLFAQSIYYGLKLDVVCRKIRDKKDYNFKYDINRILADLIFTRILEPRSKKGSYETAQTMLEKPDYELHDIYRALSVFATEMDAIQTEMYINSLFYGERNKDILYYDCTNYFFEINVPDEFRKYGHSKENRPNPIVQMGMFMDGDGIPLAIIVFDGSTNEQKSLKPLEEKILKDFDCSHFIYCSDAGLNSEDNRYMNHTGGRSFVVTQSIKKLNSDMKTWALDKNGFIQKSTGKVWNLDNLPMDMDEDEVFYKEQPYTTSKIHQRLIVTYSPKRAADDRYNRELQIDKARKMIAEGKVEKDKYNPTNPKRFVKTQHCTKDGEVAKKKTYYLDENKIAEEAEYDGLYAITTDLLETPIGKILQITEDRWRIEDCFKVLKSDLKTRPVYVRLEDHIKAHLLICFMSLVVLRFVQKLLNKDKKEQDRYSLSQIDRALRDYNFFLQQDEGFSPTYTYKPIYKDLHSTFNFDTYYEIVTKREMRSIEKASKLRN